MFLFTAIDNFSSNVEYRTRRWCAVVQFICISLPGTFVLNLVILMRASSMTEGQDNCSDYFLGHVSQTLKLRADLP